jgi:hypothetical protein
MPIPASDNFASQCVPLDTNVVSVPCEANCNNRAVTQAYEPFLNPLQERALKQGNPALLPAITVCRQQLWRGCVIDAPVHPFNVNLYRRDCFLAKPRKTFG